MLMVLWWDDGSVDDDDVISRRCASSLAKTSPALISHLPCRVLQC